MGIFPYLNVEETSKFTGYTVGRIRQLLLVKELLGQKIGQRAWLVHIDDARALRKKRLLKNRGLTRH